MLRLLRAQARRDRWQLTIWILGTTLFAVGSGSAVLKEFTGERDRASLLQLAAANPALLAIRGVPSGASSGAVIAFEIFTYIAICAALMSTFLTVRHSRGDEENGRTELLRSTPIGRTSALAATLTLGFLANLVLAVLIALGFTAIGLPAQGSWLLGLAVGGTGLAFCGIAAIAAQVAQTARAANTIAGFTIAIAFGLRAIGDALGTPSKDLLHVTSAWPSWLSPIGWGQQVRPFGDDNALPLVLDVALFAVATAIAVVVARSRDLGEGVIRERRGRESAGAGLRGSLGLAWRLQRPAVIGWAVGGALLGLFAGGLAKPAIDAVKTNPSVAAAIKGLVAGGGSLIEVFLAAIMAFLSVLAAGAGIQAVMRARSEQVDGHAELLLATPVGRGRILRDGIIVAVLSVLIVVVVGGLVAALAFVAGGESDEFWPAIGSAAVQLPAALVFAGVTALVFALIPRATIGLGWGLLALGFILGEFGSLLKMPEWLRNVSPFTHTPVVPSDSVDWWALVILALIAVVGGAVALVIVRRRDLVT